MMEKQTPKEIAEARKNNAKLFTADFPFTEDHLANAELRHSINMIMLGYLVYVPAVKLLKITEAGDIHVQRLLANSVSEKHALKQ